MSFSNTFINIINHIEDQNQSADPRGLKVKESILSNFVIDPKEPIANFENRKFNWKYFTEDFLFYCVTRLQLWHCMRSLLASSDCPAQKPSACRIHRCT